MEERERNVDTLTLCPATPSFKSCRDSLEGLELKFTHASEDAGSGTDTGTWGTSNKFNQPDNDIDTSLEHNNDLGAGDIPLEDGASYKESGTIYNSNDEDELIKSQQNDNVEDFMDNFLLDSIAVQCHASVFFTQFLCHLFFPLSYYLINYRAQGFDIHSNFLCNPISYFNIIFPSLIYLMVVMYYLCPLEDELPIRGALWVPIIFFIQHRMTVGLKYASLSPSEYAKFQASPDSTQAEAFMLQMQLLTGWANRTDQLLQFELGCAAARIGAKINEVSIVIPNPSESETTRNEFANWNALLHRESTVSLLNNRIAKELVPHADGSYTLSVYDLSMSILKKTDTSSSQRVKWLIYVFVCMMIVVPWINLFRTANQFTHRSMYLFVFLGCNMVTLGVYGMVVFMLLYVSVWDVSRQWHMVRYLHRLIRISDLTLDSDLVTFRKGKNTARNREHLRERMSVILSATQPERHKSLAIRTSQAAPKTFPLYYEGTSPFTAPTIPTTTNTTTTNIHIQSQVSNKELRSRFSEFGTKSLKDEDASCIPQISLKHAENVIGWTYTRLVIQHFGERFRNRIDMYTGGTVLLMLSLMGVQLLMVVVDTNPLAVFETVFFKQSILAVILMWLFLLACTALGALVNSQLNLHSRTFAAHKLRLSDEIMILNALNQVCEDNDKAITRLNEALTALDNCKDVVETYTELKPFSVFGFKTEASTVFTVFSTVISFFGVLFSIYSNAAQN